jgi:hypothetical protein
MEPAFYEISIWRGSTRDLEFRFPLNLMGATASLVYKMGGLDIEVPFSLAEYDNSPTWAATATLTKEETLALPEGRKITYEFKIKSGSRSVTYLYGNLFVQGANSGN